MDLIVFLTLITPVILYQIQQNKSQHECNLTQELRLYELASELKKLEARLETHTEVTELRLEALIKNTDKIIDRLVT